MAEKSGFFNSSNGDRKYKAEFFAEYFASFIGNGIFPNPSTGLQVMSNSNMTITLKAGKAWIKGYYYCNDADMVMSVDNADGALNRIDKIVLRYDNLNRTIAATIKKGSFATTPASPTLQRDANSYELGLADVYINKGIISIAQSNITDLRLDNTKCGVVHGTVDQVDTTTLFNQYQSWLSDKKTQYDTDMTNWATQKKTEYDTWFNTTTTTDQNEFNTWFNGIKATLSSDVVGSLNNKINSIQIYPMAQGTANAIILSDLDFVDGNSKTFRVANNNNSVATTINGKPLYKGNTTNPPALTKGKAVTVWYDLAGDCFFKASATGQVLPSNVLAGEIFSTENDTDLVGTMPNNGAVIITPSTTSKPIPLGYHNGLGTVATDANLISANIKAGKSIFGVAGSSTVVDTADATATAAQVLSSKTVYVNGTKLTGTMTNITTDQNAISTATSGTTIGLKVPVGYWDGTHNVNIASTTIDSDLVSSNIVNGINILGVTGTATILSLGGKRYVTGSVTPIYAGTNVDVGFQPTIVIGSYQGSSGKIIMLASPLTTDYGSMQLDMNSNGINKNSTILSITTTGILIKYITASFSYIIIG